MRRMGIAAFTQRGRELAGRLETALRPGWEVCHYEKNLSQWCGQLFQEADALIFVGACGIAVRTIAPFLKSKTTDPAVLVIDEAGQFVISLLSGHIGGANEFAAEVAALIGAVPVITTASDVNGKIAVDVFAKKNHLTIGSMKAARDMAAAILRGDRVGVYCTGTVEGKIPAELTVLSGEGGRRRGPGSSDAKGDGAPVEDTALVDHVLWISEYEPDEKLLQRFMGDKSGTVLHLIPRSVVLGVGCRRGKPGEEILAAAGHVLQGAGISARALFSAASIDLKKEEPGILELCRIYGLDYVTYSAEELMKVQGDFNSSDFVKKTTGVDNVCERSALLAAGENAELIQRKYAENGVTAALAAREWRVRFEK